MFKDFDAALQEKVGGRPEFVLGGQKFTCRAKLPWKKFSTMILQLQTGIRPEGKTEIEQTEEFFNMVLIASDRKRFMELLNKEDIDEDDEDDPVVAGNLQIGQLLDWLMAYYLGKDEETEQDPPKVEDDEVSNVPAATSLNPVG